MKTFNASDMAHKRTEIFESASSEGAIIQRKRTNGELIAEFVLIPKESLDELISGSIELSNLVAELGEKAGINNA